ncbi:unnamed protein product [Meloidogyne enterolobii]|uniref:Uncharacterized protein n=1 Tax=Meloidogyne enterolobii TaxID=390850 RepID=A0ACB0ZVS8_MELEN
MTEDYIPTPEYKINPELHGNVYPPSEDTFLLIDALSKEKDVIISLNPLICLEIGCGSGIVSCFLQKLLKNNLLTSNLKLSSIQKSCIKEIQINTPKTGTITSNKITLHLKPVGNAPQLRKEFTKYKVDPNWTIFNLQQTLKKLLGVKTDPIYLFIKEAFAPSPESTISSLYQCFGTDGGILYIHYGLTPAWG